MDNDTIKIANRIITKEDLEKIFNKINSDLLENKKIYEKEKNYNENIDYSSQHWTLKSFLPFLKFTINFYDDTEITIDNYDSFMNVFNTRLSEIKYLSCSYIFSYTIQEPNKESIYINQNVHIYVTESEANFSFSFSSEDNKLNEIYELIKNIVLNAPEKYDYTMRNKNKIMTKIGFAIGLIPSIILSTLLLFVPVIKDIIIDGYIIYPIICIVLGFLFSMFCNNKVQYLYNKIIRDKKYLGYDYDRNKSVYGDDIDKFKSNGEVLIGKNMDNLKYRDEIKNMDEKYSKYIPLEIITILIFTCLIILLKFIIH